MKTFYCTQAAATTKVNRIGGITFKLLGSARVPLLKAKAMDTHCSALLVLELLAGHFSKIGRRYMPLQTCVVNLLRFLLFADASLE